MYSNIFSSEIRQQNRTLTGLPSVAEQNGLPYQSRAKRIAEWNNYKTYFNCKTKYCKDFFSRVIGLLLVIRNKILFFFIFYISFK